MGRYRKTKHEYQFDEVEVAATPKKTVRNKKFDGEKELDRPFDFDKVWANVNDEAVKRLAMDIVTQSILEYKIAWQRGAKNELKSIESFLEDDDRIRLYTSEQFCSDFILKNLHSECVAAYGSFEVIYQAKYERCMEQINPIEDELDKYSKQYLIETKLNAKEKAFVEKYEENVTTSRYYRKKLKDIPESDKSSKALALKRTLYAKAKKYKNTAEDTKKYKKLLRKIALTKEEKKRVKKLNLKVKPWYDILYE